MKKETILKIVAILLLLIFIICPFVGMMYYQINQNQSTIETISNDVIIEEIVKPEESIITESEENVIAEPEEDINSLEATTMYTTTGVRLRSQPSLEGEIIDTLAINTELEKIGEENDWTIVRVDGQKYYIYSLYISSTKTEIKVSSRSTTTERTITTSSSTGILTASKGVNYYNGHKETYYSQKVLPGGGLRIPRPPCGK